MHIGVDFDNTIVCYDRAFQRAARDRNLIPDHHVPPTKRTIRDHLRTAGREDEWTELQGTVYGPGMADADPFPGARAFFARCLRDSVPVCIISHRTRYPYLGPRHDLHKAARAWLRDRMFAADPAWIDEHVFLEETKPAKLDRITAAGCTHFIDDLPEFLADPAFPANVTRILFSPGSPPSSVSAGITVATSWRNLIRLLFETRETK